MKRTFNIFQTGNRLVITVDGMTTEEKAKLINALLGDLPVTDIPEVTPVVVEEAQPEVENMQPVQTPADVNPPISWDDYNEKEPHKFLKTLNSELIKAAKAKDKDMRERLCAQIKEWARKNQNMPDKGLRGCITNGCDTLFFKSMSQYLAQKGIADGVKAGSAEYAAAVKTALKTSTTEDLRALYDSAIVQNV